jgi:hypothetical protein
MAKIYSKKSLVSKMKPRKEVVSFFIKLFKGASVIEIDNHSFEIISN